MADDGAMTLYTGKKLAVEPALVPGVFATKVRKARELLAGGAIFEVFDSHQAKIAESAGACAVSIVNRGVCRYGDVIGRMADPALIQEIMSSVKIPIVAKSRVGHFVEAQILETINVDYIDESELLSVADEENFINKQKFNVPFICGCRDLGEAMRRIREGAAMIRTQGDLIGSGNIAETVGNVRRVMADIRVLNNMDGDEVFAFAKNIGAPHDVVMQTKQLSRLPVMHFAAGGILTPADAALMMQLGCDGVFIGVEIFDCRNPFLKVRGIVEAVRNYNDPHVLARMSSGLSQGFTTLSIYDDADD
ncbi:Pyridoxal 5'-phosphate synthase-like subunit PDX1.2 [Dionaea muscipula]